VEICGSELLTWPAPAAPSIYVFVRVSKDNCSRAYFKCSPFLC